MHGNHPQEKPSSVGGRQSSVGSRQLAATTTTPGRTQHTARTAFHPARLMTDDCQLTTGLDWTTWWLWRGAYTRSHPELGRENPQRPWYCVLRHGRVGRRQVFQPINTMLKPPQDAMR